MYHTRKSSKEIIIFPFKKYVSLSKFLSKYEILVLLVIIIRHLLYLCLYMKLPRPRLGGGNRMERKRMKRIILEYSSISLFVSFNGGNEKLIPLFGSFSGMEWNW